MAISHDLRIRVVKKVASGQSCRQAAAHFQVSPSSAIRFVQRYEEEGTVAVRQPPPRRRRLDPYGDDILRWIEETSEMILEELSDRLGAVHGGTGPPPLSTIGSEHGKSAGKKPRTPLSRNAAMFRLLARFGASVEPGCWPTRPRLVISSSLMRPVSRPRWRASGGVVHEVSGWSPRSRTGTGKP